MWKSIWKSLLELLDTPIGWVFKLLGFLRVPWLVNALWPLLAQTSPLTQDEIDSASDVLGLNAIPFASVRIAEGGLLPLFFKLNRKRAFTLFRVVNLPLSGSHVRSNRNLLLHELVHVLQFETIGGLYIWQALRAQWTEGYGYGGTAQLAQDRQCGKHYADYNREQQAQIVQDYYESVVVPGLAEDDLKRKAYEPFIQEMRSAQL